MVARVRSRHGIVYRHSMTLINPKGTLAFTKSGGDWVLGDARKIDPLLSSEGISDANSSYRLAVVQIFGPEHVTSRFRRGLKHHSIPEVELRLCDLELACRLSAHGARRGSRYGGRACQGIGPISSQQALACARLKETDIIAGSHESFRVAMLLATQATATAACSASSRSRIGRAAAYRTLSAAAVA